MDVIGSLERLDGIFNLTALLFLSERFAFQIIQTFLTPQKTPHVK